MENFFVKSGEIYFNLWKVENFFVKSGEIYIYDIYHHKQTMLVAMQKLAKQHAVLLKQSVAAEQHVAECDAQHNGLHEEANAVHDEQTHTSQIGFYLFYL